MCRPKSSHLQTAQTTPDDLVAKKSRSFLSLIWPIHPLGIVALLPVLPTWLYLNRGYTVWFHLITIVYLLTNREFLRRFLIIQGAGITLGWYTAIYNDLHLHGRFCHILYHNMPTAMKAIMVDTEGKIMYTAESLATMCLSHALDTFLHPGLVYLLWRGHCSSGKSIADIVSWPAVFATYAFSRLWSVVHTFTNTGEVGWFYFGYDVYHIHDLDSWMPAYCAEGLFYLGIIAYKVAWEPTKTLQGEAKVL